MRVRWVFSAFPMNRLAKAFALSVTRRFVRPNKSENFYFQLLFNYWEENNEETSLNCTGGRGSGICFSPAFRCASVLLGWGWAGLLRVLPIWLLLPVPLLPATLLQTLLLVRRASLLSSLPASSLLTVISLIKF